MRMRIARTLYLTLYLFSFNALAGTVNWRQEVQLQDGRIVIVDRVSKQTGNLFPANTVIEYEQEISFVHPDTKVRIGWALPKGSGGVMLDFEGTTPYLVLRTQSVADYNNWGCPNPPWLVFRYEQGNWNRIAIEQLPIRFRLPNLLLAAGTNPRIVSDGVVTVIEYQEHIKRAIKQYRVVSRGKVNPIAMGCEESVLIRQGRRSEIDTRR